MLIRALWIRALGIGTLWIRALRVGALSGCLLGIRRLSVAGGSGSLLPITGCARLLVLTWLLILTRLLVALPGLLILLLVHGSARDSRGRGHRSLIGRLLRIGWCTRLLIGTGRRLLVCGRGSRCRVCRLARSGLLGSSLLLVAR